jgi:putative endonuclease
MKQFYVYIMANRARTLYTGVTSALPHRLWQHKHMQIDGFTKRYLIDRLVYYEVAPDAASAIQREKQIKGWVRRKKVALIESVNPKWQDLSEDFLDIRPTFSDREGSFRESGRRDSSLSNATVARETGPRGPSNVASRRGAQNDNRGVA